MAVGYGHTALGGGYIAPAAKNCNRSRTKRLGTWPYCGVLGVLLAMTARMAKSARWGCGVPVVLGLWGCSGAVTPETEQPWGETQPSANSNGDTGPSPTDPSNSPSAETVGETTEPEGSGVSEPASTASPPPAANPAIAPTTFECDPSATSAAVPLRRLTQKQYRNSVRDTVARVLGSDAAVDAELDTLLGEVPEDERLKLPEDLHGTYRRLDQRVQQPLVDAWFTVGVNVGKWLAVPERLSSVVGNCDQFASSTECIHAFIGRWGRLLLRRPLSDAEIDFYYGFYEPSTGVEAAGVADVIAGMLNAPDFLYLVEGHADGSGGAETNGLTAHELAARMSYHFWNTTPDATLAELADSGQLLDEQTYQEQVDRLFNDERSKDAVADFYAEWLKLEELADLDRNNDSSLFQAFAGEHLPSEQLADAMRDEVSSLLDFYTFQQPGGISEILSTPYSFATSSELAALYGVQPWDREEAPPSVGAARPGLLTRAAFLATGTANTRPIMRGLFVRTNVLCDTIAPPPAAAGATPPELSPDATTRQVVEELTSPDACFGCHNAFLNPLGFAFEGFDSLGRSRTEQQLFDDEGRVLGARPIDTQSIPQVVLGDATESSGPEDLMRLLAESGKVEACVARQYFRYTFGRWEHVAADGCALEEMRQSLSSRGSLAAMLRDVALGSAFRSRAVTTVDGEEP